MQAVLRDMGVDLGGGDIGVAEHGLHASQIGAALDQMGGEGVAQDMRRQFLRIDACLDGKRLEQLVTTAAGEWPSALREGNR